MTAPVLPLDPSTAPEATWAIETVWHGPMATDGPTRGGALPPALADRYRADLVIPLRGDRPTIAANFVSTLDGVVAFDPGGPGGGRTVSGGLDADRFLMGLLRATADAVLVGAGTVRASASRSWTPGRVHPASAGPFADWRRALGLAPEPTAVLLTGSGVLHTERPWLPRGDQPLLVVTSDQGARRLRTDGPPGIEIESLGSADRSPIGAVIDLLAARGYRLVLCEAGPTVFGELLAADLVDELFLTLAPRLAGRSHGTPRPGLVDGVAFDAPRAPTGRLRSIMRSGDHLFLRHALGPAGSGTGGPS